MQHDAGERILFVGEHGAAIETGGIGTVMARGRDGLEERMLRLGADKQARVAPGLVLVEAIKRMAGGDAGLAAGAAVEVDLEGVLFAGAGRRERNELNTERGEPGGVTVLLQSGMRAGEARHRRLQLLLVGEELVDQREFFFRRNHRDFFGFTLRTQSAQRENRSVASLADLA